MIDELKLNHSEKMTELKIAQSKESEKQQEDHLEYLENARSKFEEEKAKLEA
jgi:hypothetical protein